MDYKTVFANDKKGHIICNVPYLEIYIPMAFFDKSGKIAVDNGDTITSIACLPIGLFENGKLKEIRTIKLGERMNFFVYDSEVVNMALPGSPEGPVKVLKYFKGHEIFNDYIVQNSSSIQAYIELILGGKIPSTLSYSAINTIWNKNLEMNNGGLGVPATNRELVLSVQCRDQTAPTRIFAERLNDTPNATEYEYAMVNMRQICQFSSTFAALTFEDFDSMVTSSLKRTKEHLPEPESPLEQLIKM